MVFVLVVFIVFEVNLGVVVLFDWVLFVMFFIVVVGMLLWFGCVEIWVIVGLVDGVGVKLWVGLVYLLVVVIV